MKRWQTRGHNKESRVGQLGKIEDRRQVREKDRRGGWKSRNRMEIKTQDKAWTNVEKWIIMFKRMQLL